MGSAQTAPLQVLLVGPPNSGKTTLLYSQVFQTRDYQETPTTGFQFEEIALSNTKYGVWDISGSLPEPVLRQLYQMVQFSALLYVADPFRHADHARRHLEFLLAEVELQSVQTCLVIYNARANEQEMDGFREHLDKRLGLSEL